MYIEEKVKTITNHTTLCKSSSGGEKNCLYKEALLPYIPTKLQ